MKITFVFTKEIVKTQKIIIPTMMIEKDGTTTHIVFAFWHTMRSISFVR